MKHGESESFSSSLDFCRGQFDQDKTLKNPDQFSRTFHGLLKNDTLVGAVQIYTNIRNASEKKCLWETDRAITGAGNHPCANNFVTQHPSAFPHPAEPGWGFTNTRTEIPLFSVPSPLISFSPQQRPLCLELAGPAEDHLVLVDQLTEVPQLVQGQRGAMLPGHGNGGVLVFYSPIHSIQPLGITFEGFTLSLTLEERRIFSHVLWETGFDFTCSFSQRWSKGRREGGMH